MAGYIMTLSSEKSLKQCINSGTYSTNLSPPNGIWRAHHEGTFADFLSMKAGDNIYFFFERKIYGIGIIKNVKLDCKFLNYIDADNPIAYSEKEYNDRLPLLRDATPNNRCFCTFTSSPHFFKAGIDMDDVLNSNPSAFRMIRVMWKVSFIKIDDDENRALVDIILKRNEDKIESGNDTFSINTSVVDEIEKRITSEYKLTASKILLSCFKNNKIKHEMAIEASLCGILIRDNDTPFGKWDYISHQVVASPFKAVDYMDKMDIFGYRFIQGYPTKSKYLVIEIKKDVANVDAIDQIMKYVDWIQSEYAYGDYSMIEAYVVASGFTDAVVKKRNNECVEILYKRI